MRQTKVLVKLMTEVDGCRIVWKELPSVPKLNDVSLAKKIPMSMGGIQQLNFPRQAKYNVSPLV